MGAYAPGRSVVELALRECERRTLRIGEAGEPAGRHLDRPGVQLAATVAGSGDGAVEILDREVRHPVGRLVRLVPHRAAVRPLAVADHVVGRAVTGWHGLERPAEEIAVEAARSLEVRCVEVVPR